MKRFKLLLFAAALLCGAAYGQSCDDLIQTNNSALIAGALEASVNALVNDGADVRVRVVGRAGMPLERYEKSVERSCQSWQAADGGRKNNLIAIFAAVADRKSGIYFGSQWKPALDSAWPRIESSVMAPRFRDGDIGGGISAGLAEIHTLITTRQAAPSVIVQTSTPSAPTDFSGLWSVLWWVLIVGAVGCAAFFFTRMYVARKRTEDARLGAQSDALMARQQAGDLVMEATTGILAHDAAANQEAKMLVDRAVEAFASLGSGAGDPAGKHSTQGQYVAISKRYQSVIDDIHRAQQLVRPAGTDAAERMSPSAGVIDNHLEFHHLESHVHPRRARAPVQTVGAAVYHDTTVIPVFIPEPVPEYYPPASAPLLGGSGDSSPSDSSDSGGSSSWGSSSSDSGGSSDFGSSDSGIGGGDSNW